MVIAGVLPPRFTDGCNARDVSHVPLSDIAEDGLLKLWEEGNVSYQYNDPCVGYMSHTVLMKNTSPDRKEHSVRILCDALVEKSCAVS